MRPTDIPVLPSPAATVHPADPIPDLVATTVAMASRITIQVPDRFGSTVDGRARRAAAIRDIERTLELFHDVDRTCTRFRDDSDLMRANAHPTAWVPVDELCFHAVREAHAAYLATDGRFDPRVLADLVRLGYGRSFTLGGAEPRTPDEVRGSRPPLAAWRPQLRASDHSIRLSGEPAGQAAAKVDLGGIGKGLAVRWASERLRDCGLGDHLVEAGGDCFCAGRPSDGGQWRVGIEDPAGGYEPIAVLEVSNEAVTTSSVRLRHWQVGDQSLHHIIDPSTGRPGGDGLLAVTTVHPDPAMAEVWAKVLFLSGAANIATEAARRGLPALWVEADGALGWSPALSPRLLWRRS